MRDWVTTVRRWTLAYTGLPLSGVVALLVVAAVVGVAGGAVVAAGGWDAFWSLICAG